MPLSRRDFARLAVGGALLTSTRSNFAAPRCAGAIKISLQLPADYDDEDLTFAKQLGVEYVSIPNKNGSAESFIAHKNRIEAAGLHVANIGNAAVHNMAEVTLNLPGRDAKIEEY